ncbi:MAG: DUF937 domain-containing protein [Flectobacillus sp.]|uniref:DUF937 domain-containing protein n=1 Tax=Flectobacillus sp. TaxID=50419 RepID=UPI003B9BB98B
MLEQLMGLIQDHSQDAIVNNPAIPNEKNNDAMQTILGAITGGLQQQAQGGGLASVMGLLGGQAGTSGGNLMSNPIVANITQQAVSGLMQKFGLENSAAAGIVSQVLPGVIGSVISKTNDPNDNSLNLSDFTSAFNDGKFDMNDVSNIAGKLLGGNSGGLGGMLGGLFK